MDKNKGCYRHVKMARQATRGKYIHVYHKNRRCSELDFPAVLFLIVRISAFASGKSMSLEVWECLSAFKF